MPDSRPLTLRIAQKKDFAILNRILFLLVLLSFLLSPQPVALTSLAALGIGIAWIAHAGYIYRANNHISDAKLTLIIFMDGRVRLDSICGGVVEGFMNGQQWCTHRVAVLRIATGGETQKLIILSGHQATDEYRRLNVWLRQNIFADTSDKLVSAGLPASRV